MEDITVSELKERLERGEKFHFIDVREEWEYEEDNLGADNIPLGELAHQLSQLEKIKDEEIVVHCRSGARSGNAKNGKLRYQVGKFICKPLGQLYTCASIKLVQWFTYKPANCNTSTYFKKI